MKQIMDPAELATQFRNLNTPCYIFYPQAVIDSYTELKRVLGTGLIVSFKANPNPELFRSVVHVFDAIELASVGELDIVVTQTSKPKFLNNPSLDAYAIRAGIASKATIILDNLGQVRDFVRLTKSLPAASPVIRINGGSIMRAAGRSELTDYFGMDKRTLWAAAETLKESGIHIRGLHVFTGSYNFKKNSADLGACMLDLIEEFETIVGYRMSFLNLGGGFPENWRDMDFDFANYREIIAPLTQRFEVVHEAGRAVYGQCGYFVTRVVATKTIGAESIVICDGGMAQNYLLSKASNPLRKLQSPQIVRLSAKATVVSDVRARIIGSTCSGMDCIGEIGPGAPLPDVGDYCVFSDCGAYNHTYTVADFLSSKKAAIYLRS